MTGKFIVFEGGDGVGKSTQVGLLVAALREQGHDVVETRQPGGTELGGELRRLILDPARTIADRAEALLYAADKAQHVEEVVRPALRQDKIVVCDRYVDSMIAYQGAGRALSADEVAEIAWWGTRGLKPDLTVVLDAEVDVGLDRISRKDRLEAAGIEFHRRARQHLLDLAAAEPNRYVVLTAHQDRYELAQAVLQQVHSRFFH
ncbi:MAG: dTMP kinase [Arachnia propionica]|nr:MAG: dTMP kinase [Arachnia propionica]